MTLPLIRLPLPCDESGGEQSRDSTESIEELSKCRKNINKSRKIAVCFFSNPTWGREESGCMLPSIYREMKYVLANTNPFDFWVVPGSTAHDVLSTLERFQPLVCMFSGHVDPGGAILLEQKTRLPERGKGNGHPRAEAMASRMFIDHTACVGLTIINACYSARCVREATVTERRAPASPRAFIVWESQVLDAAALVFCRGLLDRLVEIIGEAPPDLSVMKEEMHEHAKSIFDSGVQAFLRQGFLLGDPGKATPEGRVPDGMPVLVFRDPSPGKREYRRRPVPPNKAEYEETFDYYEQPDQAQM
jgi:hypothetical protein